MHNNWPGGISSAQRQHFWDAELHCRRGDLARTNEFVSAPVNLGSGFKFHEASIRLCKSISNGRGQLQTVSTSAPTLITLECSTILRHRRCFPSSTSFSEVSIHCAICIIGKWKLSVRLQSFVGLNRGLEPRCRHEGLSLVYPQPQRDSVWPQASD